ncbi:MAG: flagellar biosynthetic protein FliQ [Bryobacterales bacterium]|nr:flagellar biosynthetic protein FliQ [Bryobacterales bacterium]
MSPEAAIHLIRQAALAAFWVSAPLLVIGFVVGVVVSLYGSLVQVLTSMQDAAFNAIPRLGAFLAGFLLLLPWMLRYMTSYTQALLGDFTRYAR